MFCLNGRVSEMVGRGWFSCSFVPVFPFGRTCPSHHLSPVGHGSPKGTGGGFWVALGAPPAPWVQLNLGAEFAKFSVHL